VEYLDLGARLPNTDPLPCTTFAFLASEQRDASPNIFFRAEDEGVYYRHVWPARRDAGAGTGTAVTCETLPVCVARAGSRFAAASYPSWTDLRELKGRRLPTLMFVAEDGSMRQIQVSVDALYRGAVNARQVFGGGCAVGGLRDVWPGGGGGGGQEEEGDAPPGYEELF
jgi:hypothetical protein